MESVRRLAHEPVLRAGSSRTSTSAVRTTASKAQAAAAISRSSISGFAPYLIGTIPIGPVELFGKVGYYFYDIDFQVDIDDPTFPDVDGGASDEDLLYGFGVGMTFFERLNARLEYEKIDCR